MSKKLAIIGGGISGLSAAYFALQKGHAVALFEKSERLGGLADSLDFDGLMIERFYHFICGGDDRLLDLASQLGLDEHVRFRPTKTAYYLNGRYYPFTSGFDLLRFSALPFSSRIRFGLNVASSKLSSRWEHLDGLPAKDWLIHRIGARAYRAIWEPLLKIKFYDQHDRISAAWIWHRIHRVTSSRRTLLSKERMGYFVGGTQTVITALEKSILGAGGKIFLRTEITSLERSKGRLLLESGNEQRNGYDGVVLSVPLPRAARLVQSLDPAYARKLSSVEFIGVVCGLFRLRKPVSGAFWLNINDPRLPANGLIEYTNLNPMPEIASDHIVYIPLYVPENHSWYSLDESSLKREFFHILSTIHPELSEEDIVGFRSFREPYAQAVCPIGFKTRVPTLAAPIPGLFLLDSTQLYPSDRSLSGLVGLAESMIQKYF